MKKTSVYLWKGQADFDFKKGGKDQEGIQSSAMPDAGYHMGK